MYNRKKSVLLENILHASDASQYLPKFTKLNIKGTQLSDLTDEDLIEIGVTEENIRKKLLMCAKPLEPKKSFKVQPGYDIEVLKRIYDGLVLIHAHTSYTHLRKDIVPCNLKMYPITKLFHSTTKQLQKELEEYKDYIGLSKERPNKTKRKILLLSGIICSSSLLCVLILNVMKPLR